MIVEAVAMMAVALDLDHQVDHSVDFVVYHLAVNHLEDLRDNHQVPTDYLDTHCMMDDLLRGDTFDYREDIDKEIVVERFDVDSSQADSCH